MAELDPIYHRLKRIEKSWHSDNDFDRRIDLNIVTELLRRLDDAEPSPEVDDIRRHLQELLIEITDSLP